jgi:hypothetical protein
LKSSSAVASMVRSSLRVSAAAAPRRQRSEWSVDQCARFAALKEYHLIRALTNDLRTLAEARKVGLLPEAPHQGAEGDKEEQDGFATQNGATRKRRRKRRPPKEAREDKEQPQDEGTEGDHRPAAAAAAKEPGVAAPAATTAPSTEATQAAAAAAASTPAQLAPPAQPGTAAGTEEAPASAMAIVETQAHEKRGSRKERGYATPEKEAGGASSCRETRVAGGGKSRRARLDFREQDQDKIMNATGEIDYNEVRAQMQAMPKDELESRQQHATQLAAKIESVGYARHLDDCKLHCRLVFKPGFEVGIYTAADLADLGIPTEGIEMVMEDQDAEGRARVGAGGW